MVEYKWEKNMNRGKGSDMPKISEKEKKEVVIPKLTAVRNAILAKNKARATKLYADVEPYITAQHRESLKKKINSLKTVEKKK